MKKYAITVTTDQARLICTALDIYSRIGAGQLEVIQHELHHFDRMKDFHEALPAFKTAATGFSRGESYGIYQSELPDRFKNAYDIVQVLRHKLAWDREPEGGHSNDFHEPMFAGTDKPVLIKEAE